MTITKRILDWEEKELDKLDANKKGDCVKAFGLGMIEGAVDSAVVLFPFVLCGAYYWKYKSLKK